jgi:hypothetical protein
MHTRPGSILCHSWRRHDTDSCAAARTVTSEHFSVSSSLALGVVADVDCRAACMESVALLQPSDTMPVTLLLVIRARAPVPLPWSPAMTNMCRWC